MARRRSDPFRDLRANINRLFDQILSSFEAEEDIAAVGSWRPPVDIYETENAIAVRVDLPGLEKDEVDVRIDDGTLVIRGERKPPKRDKHNYYSSERPYGKFYRSFDLPSKVDINRISATLKDGVLEVVLPKAEEAKPKQIPVSNS